MDSNSIKLIAIDLDGTLLNFPIISENSAIIMKNNFEVIRDQYLHSPISQDIIAYGSHESYAMSVYYAEKKLHKLKGYC